MQRIAAALTERFSPPVVAIINTSVEIRDLLQDAFTDEGFQTVTAFTYEFKRGERDFRTFVAEHRPHAILWDIAIPYEENWEYFRKGILGFGVVPEHCFICSTANKTALDLLVGPTPTIELIGCPFDLQMLIDVVRRVVEGPPDG